MVEVAKSVLVEYSAEQMFALVDQVERYPEFLPWCGGAEVERAGGAAVIATIHVDFHHLRQSFSTENTRQPPRLIEMKLRHGPFRRLQGVWRFIALDGYSCKVEFHIVYEFSSKLLEKLLGPMFHHVADSLVDAFVRRAEIVYRRA